MKGFRHFRLEDKDWGEIKIFLPIPKRGNPWGALSPLKGTIWEKTIQEVSGESMSEALHGFATPLMREIGRKPPDQAKKISVDERWCAAHAQNTCGVATDACRADSGKALFCFEAKLEDPEQQVLASRVVQAWVEGYYVVVVVGDEFSLSRV